MKEETIRKRMEKLAAEKKVSKTSSAWKLCQNLSTGKVLRPCWQSGSGRFTSNMDYTSDTERLLDLLKIKYKSGNDAPRGGLTGNYIKILTKIIK